MHLCAFTQYRITFQLKSFQRLEKKRKKERKRKRKYNLWWADLAIWQVPTKEAPSLLFSAGEGRENVTKGSWVKIRAGNINQVRSGFLKFLSLDHSTEEMERQRCAKAWSVQQSEQGREGRAFGAAGTAWPCSPEAVAKHLVLRSVRDESYLNQWDLQEPGTS